MLTTLIHANYCLLSLFITWRMYSFKISSKAPRQDQLPAAKPLGSFSLFQEGSHWISFHFFFFSSPFAWHGNYELAWLCQKSPSEMFISWGKSQGNSVFITSRGWNPEVALGPAGGEQRRSVHVTGQLWCHNPQTEPPVARPGFVLWHPLIKCTSRNNAHLISDLHLTLGTNREWVGKANTLYD